MNDHDCGIVMRRMESVRNLLVDRLVDVRATQSKFKDDSDEFTRADNMAKRIEWELEYVDQLLDRLLHCEVCNKNRDVREKLDWLEKLRRSAEG